MAGAPLATEAETMDRNARIINAQITAARRNPARAGYDDGFDVGLMTQGPVSYSRYADPRWAGSNQYRAAFVKGMKAGRAERRWIEEDAS